MDNFIQAFLFALLPIGGGVVTWFLKSNREERLLIEERSREYKIKTYETLLEPFMGVFTVSVPKHEQERYMKKLLTVEYRKAGFNLMTFGSDEVIKAYNDLMQHFYNQDESLGLDINTNFMFKYFSTFLMCVRKDLYSKNTRLKNSQLLEFVLSDIRQKREMVD